ncbi:MAG: RDD family protein [Spirochaetia bacterium]|nr:RDD family protein [Spirochaetia bacterium]
MKEPSLDLDSKLEIPAPEFIVFRMHTAGPVARFFAVLVDQVIIAFLLMAIIFFSVVVSVSETAWGKNSGIGTFIFFLLFFILQWFYFFVFEWLNKGRTVGKMALGLRVVSMDGTTLDAVQILIRNLLRVADMFPLKFLAWLLFLPTYSIGLVSMFLTAPRFRRLGDLAAGTIVIREMQEAKAVNANYPVNETLARQIAFKAFPSATLVQALHDFAGRYETLHPARRHEIADRVRERLEWLTGKVDCTSEELLLLCHYRLTHEDRRN